MIKKYIFSTLIGVLTVTNALCQSHSGIIPAQLNYEITVYENKDDGLTFNEPVIGTRGILGDMWKQIRQQYANTIQGQVTTTSAELLAAGVGYVVDKLRSHKQDWYQQAQMDCRLTKSIPMPSEIANFYATTSDKGATDPQKMLFNGFGCQQYYEVKSTVDGKPKTERVLGMDMKCSLRKDSLGMTRMLHHGKFEVLLDYFYFNPNICSLPNDSLKSNQMDLRTPFDFQRRKNLRFNIKAEITSSWMNEAIQIVENQKLGEFTISVNIPDSTYLEQTGFHKGCFVYIRPDKELYNELGLILSEEDSLKMSKISASVNGESFLVPRSFIGTEDGKGYKRTWGTGQYKINMTLTENCDINLLFYYTPQKEELKSEINGISQNHMAGPQVMGMDNPFSRKNHWNHYWSEEWNKMKKRHKSPNSFTLIWNNIKKNYSNYRWVYTLVEPVENAILAQENTFVAKQLNDWFKLGEATSLGQPSVSVGQGSAPSGMGSKDTSSKNSKTNN